MKVVKNKVAAPFREAEFDILYNEGISREGELIDFAVDKGVINKAGTWFSFGDERLGQGRENTRMYLREHADVRNKIEAKLFPLLGLKLTPAAAVFATPVKDAANGATNGAAAKAATPAAAASAAAAAPAGARR